MRIPALFKRHRPDLIIHCAAQPSHDLAARRPLDDFGINATGTLNLLETARQHCPETPFVFMSTNKVYRRRAKREAARRARDPLGVSRPCRPRRGSMRAAGSTPPSTASSAHPSWPADVMVQEYGRYFGMPTVCFRGGCLTGPNHSAAELHGFLAYLARAVKEGRVYRIYGYKGEAGP